MRPTIATFPQLETERLILREFRLDEADQMAIFHLFSDHRVTRFYNVNTFTEPEEAWQMLQRLKLDFLITHRLSVADAAAAYQLIDEQHQQTIQVILTYPQNGAPAS